MTRGFVLITDDRHPAVSDEVGHGRSAVLRSKVVGVRMAQTSLSSHRSHRLRTGLSALGTWFISNLGS